MSLLPVTHTFNSGVLQIREDPQFGYVFTFTAKNGDVFETNECRKTINIFAKHSPEKIFTKPPMITIGFDQSVRADFEMETENAHVRMIKKPNPLLELERKFEGRISKLEDDAKRNEEVLADVFGILISAGLKGNNISSQLGKLLDHVGPHVVSKLTVSAAHTVMRTDDAFERLVKQGYDLRNMIGVEDYILELIDMNWFSPWYERFAINFSRVIALANVDWSATKEKNINWNRILEEFDKHYSDDSEYTDLRSDGRSEKTKVVWSDLAGIMREAINRQIAKM